MPALPWLAAILLLTLVAHGAYAGMIDLNVNGVSDIWEHVFNASGLNPNIDSDGDGVTNKLEGIAGTSPFDANSAPRVAPLVLSTTNASVSMQSSLGKKYQLQTSEVICGSNSTNWINGPSIIARSGSVVSLNTPKNAPAKFFRIILSDVDTDGDGVNDWEEYKLGLDPLVSASSGQLDGNGVPMNDYAYAIGKLASQNVVTVYASDPTAMQPDAGQQATSVGMFTVTRGGFPLNSITVNLGLGGPGTGYAVEGVDHAVVERPITLPAGVASQSIPLTPLANSNLLSPVVVQLKELSGAGYTIGVGSNATIVIYPSATPVGTGLTGQYYTNCHIFYTSLTNFNATNLFLTRVDPGIDFIYYTNTNPNLSNGFYCVRWTGQVQPQYSETYIFDTRTDDGVKLWVNDQLLIDKWQLQGATTWTNGIYLQAGVRYNIKMEYFNRGGSGRAQLSWYSPSQAKQIIPSNRLYPASVATAAAAITSPLSAVGFLNQPFSYTITGANSPTAYSAKGLPPGLGLTNAIISGVPTLAGHFEVILTATNALGAGASALALEIIDTGSAVTREVWTGVSGTSITNIPLGVPANTTNTLGTLEGITDFGDDYGERIRGYFTAPATANYYFWIAGTDSGELWISNDDEPANKVRRAWTTNSTGVHQWTAQPNQRSGWLSLVAGQRYYLEILHKAGVGAGDNWSVAWLQDPTGTNSAPQAVVPGYLLSKHFDVPPAFVPGTLYAANMLAQAGVASTAVGSATLRLSADETYAVLKTNYSTLSSPYAASHIHTDAYLDKAQQGQIIFDIDDAAMSSDLQPDGSLIWHITASGALSAADIVEIIKQGKAYINIHSMNYPAGEINGHFSLAEGSQNFTPPPPPPIAADDHTSTNAAARFLLQATFGPSPSDIESVRSLGYETWIDDQMALPPTHHLPNVLSNPAVIDPTATTYPGSLTFNTWWRHSITAPDQLRQRTAFALSEIVVVSESGVLEDNARALSDYYDVLLANAFTNYRELLKAVTLSPAMGLYLDMRRNDKGDMAAGTHPNENYAREILQLFSIGLNRMWPDGSLVMDSDGNLVPTYDQDVILGFSRVFTGWNYYQVNPTNSTRLPFNWNPNANYTNAMVLVRDHHELGSKQLLDNVVLPPAWGSQTTPSATNYDNYCLQDLDLALDSIFYNENCGPYICRQLIQRLVTSHPSRDYLYRVVKKFNDNGSGVRGDLGAVVKAILLDTEARGTNAIVLPTWGKQREALLRVTAIARAFPPIAPIAGTYSQSNNHLIVVSTPTPHRGTNNDDYVLTFTDTSGQPAPPSQAYANIASTTVNSFAVTAPGLAVGTYTNIVNMTITNQFTSLVEVTNVGMISISGHGLSPGNLVSLVFTNGNIANGLYQVIWTTANSFAIETTNTIGLFGGCLFPKWTGGGYTHSGTTVNVSLVGAHGLSPGNNVYIDFPSGAGIPSDGIYTIGTVPDATHFTVTVGISGNTTANGQVVFPHVAPALVRSGNVTVNFSTWAMNNTDGGSSSSLSQTPLNPPTVFNYFFPDYKFPGILASAGLTTPEFQLTSDTSTILLVNFITSGILNTGNNTNGPASFTSGNGVIALDFGPWITPAYTSNAGIPTLVDDLNARLCGGQLSAGAKTAIVNYVANNTNFPYTTPTGFQMRERARAVIHLIVNSPDFSIQK